MHDFRFPNLRDRFYFLSFSPRSDIYLLRLNCHEQKVYFFDKARITNRPG
jgi:hypothetical protein